MRKGICLGRRPEEQKNWLEKNTLILRGQNGFSGVQSGAVAPWRHLLTLVFKQLESLSPESVLSLILDKDRIGIAERSDKLEEIGFSIGLSLHKDAVFDRCFTDLILSILTHKSFKVDIWYGK